MTSNISSSFISQHILLPLICIIYFKYASDAMWICRPSIVGWLVATPCFFITIMIGGQFFGVFIAGIKSLLGIFSDPIGAVLMAIIGILSGLAFAQIFAEILEQFTWVILLFILCAGGSSRTYMGKFTDTSGRVFDVYR